MDETNPAHAVNGLVIVAVEWLASGGRSGLVRVRGHWEQGFRDPGLPALLVDDGAATHRFASLPDSRGERAQAGWRAAYVVNADLLEDAQSVAIEFPNGLTAPLGVPEPGAPGAEPEPEPAGGEVIDRAVLAERRARRAEASVEAQARIAREAMRAVEALELRAHELEQRLAAITRERDTLADQADSLLSPREVDALRAAVEEQAERARVLEAELGELRVRPAIEPEVAEAAARAEHLREALGTAVTTIAELRASLREAHIARRTSDVERTANAVRLAVVEADRAALLARLEAAQEGLRTAQEQMAQAQRLARGAEAAHVETRRRFTERVADLEQARARIAALEAALATVSEDAERAVRAELAERLAAAEQQQRALEARAAEAQQSLRTRAAELEAGLDETRAQSERALADMDALLAQERAAWQATESGLLERLAAAEAALARAQTARAIAEAAAASADAERRAASVATAARIAELEGRLAASEAASEVPPAPEEPAADHVERATQAGPALRLVGPPPVIPAELIAASDPLMPGRATVVADLERAAAALRAAERPAAPPAQREPAPEPERQGPTIVSARTHPPRRVAIGAGKREYPPLRGALVKLAHDDPGAAAALILGLAPAQWRCLDRPLDYDLTIGDGPTHSIEVNVAATAIAPIDFPREWGDDYFHVRADAVTIAELLAGALRFRRFGGPSVSGSRKVARTLNAIGRSQLSLVDVVRAGARIEPVLALRCLEYAIPTAWTRGHDFVVEERILDPDGEEEVVYVTARDGRGVTVSGLVPDRVPDANVVITRAAFDALLRGEAPPAGERPVVRGDHDAVDALREWAERVRTGAL